MRKFKCNSIIILCLIVITSVAYGNNDANKRIDSSKTHKSLLEKIVENDSSLSGDTIYVIVNNEMPRFAYGSDSLWKYINRNVDEHYAEGRVIVEFIVEKDGTLSNLNVVHSISSYHDSIATELVSLMDWYPGIQDGTSVRTYFRVPIYFNHNTNE